MNFQRLGKMCNFFIRIIKEHCCFMAWIFGILYDNYCRLIVKLMEEVPREHTLYYIYLASFSCLECAMWEILFLHFNITFTLHWLNIAIYHHCSLSSTMVHCHVFWTCWHWITKRALKRKLVGQYQTLQLEIRHRFRYYNLSCPCTLELIEVHLWYSFHSKFKFLFANFGFLEF